MDNNETIKTQEKKPGLLRKIFGPIWGLFKGIFSVGANIVSGIALRILPKDARDIAIQQSYNKMLREESEDIAKEKAKAEVKAIEKENDKKNKKTEKNADKEKEKILESKDKICEELSKVIQNKDMPISDRITILARRALHTREPITIKTSSNNYISLKQYGNQVKLFFSRYKDIDGIKKEDSYNIGSITFDSAAYDKFYNARNGKLFDLSLCRDLNGNIDSKMMDKYFTEGKNMIDRMKVEEINLDEFYNVVSGDNQLIEVVNELREGQIIGQDMTNDKNTMNMMEPEHVNVPGEPVVVTNEPQTVTITEGPKELNEDEHKLINYIMLGLNNMALAEAVTHCIEDGKLSFENDVLFIKDGSSANIATVLNNELGYQIINEAGPLPENALEYSYEEEEEEFVSFNPDQDYDEEYEEFCNQGYNPNQNHYTMEDALNGVEPPILDGREQNVKNSIDMDIDEH